MSTTINCNKCGNPIEITQAIRAELEEKVLRETQEKHLEELKKLQEEKINLLAQKDRELEETKKTIGEQARKEAIEKVRKEYDAKIESTKEEFTEKEKQNKELQVEMIELSKKLRAAKTDKENVEREFHKKLLEEEEQIKKQAKEEAEKDLRLKIAERDKKLSDAEKQIAELQRKIQQGSQQLQGEILELQLEEVLKSTFPLDEIIPVQKGVNGADILQKVHDRTGRTCGTIIWELKRTKAWSEGWVQKIKDDQRGAKAEVAILVSGVLPKNTKSFGDYQGIIVCDLSFAMSLATLMRIKLQEIFSLKQSSIGKNEKMEVLYNYLTGVEFKQKVEGIIESFTNLKIDLEQEKKAMYKIWAKREKQIQKVVENTSGMYGDLEGLIGKALSPVSSLELEKGQEEIAQ